MNNIRNKYQQKNRRQSSQKSSSINPKQLVKQAVNIELPSFVADVSFKEMSLNKALKKNILAKGYESPTEIQEKSIPGLIEGRNMIGIAATGTGKTGAFIIPLIERMLSNKNLNALVILPTRELALQVEAEFKSLAQGFNLNSACYIGGTSVQRDIEKARRKSNLIVGTPGRLIDLINRKALKINQSSILILDEFDRMLDMGFINDIQKIIALLEKRKQTMLFSATINPSQEKLIKQMVHNPIRINVGNHQKSSENVEQDIIRVKSSESKFDVLVNLFKNKDLTKVILFAETKRTVDKLSKQLTKVGISTDVIHGNKSQNYRITAIDKFKKGKTRILVATDVAARGIDIQGVTHVINYQLPQTMESYIHRIGRTGRAGQKGMAYTFVN